MGTHCSGWLLFLKHWETKNVWKPAMHRRGSMDLPRADTNEQKGIFVLLKSGYLSTQICSNAHHGHASSLPTHKSWVQMSCSQESFCLKLPRRWHWENSVFRWHKISSLYKRLCSFFLKIKFSCLLEIITRCNIAIWLHSHVTLI